VVRWDFERDPQTIEQPDNPWWSVLMIEKELDGPVDGWRAEVEFRVDGVGSDRPDGPPRLLGVYLRPDAPAYWNDLPTQRALRAVHNGDVLRELREWLSFVPTQGPAKVWIDAIERGRRSGRRGKSDDHYAVWAERRVRAEEIAPRTPNKWLAEQYGETVGAVSMILNRARNRGFLEGRPPRLSAKAEHLLRTIDAEGEVTQ